MLNSTRSYIQKSLAKSNNRDFNRIKRMCLVGKICIMAKKLRCEKVAKRFLRICRCPSNKKTFLNVEDAESYLNDLCLDPNNSCIYNNTISSNPQYDLQIVIPVYNAEKFIEECIESALNQSTRYLYKIILVNDGSTDNSPEIIQRYESRENVEIINQRNEGLSDARNSAIRSINAKYLLFLDADDRLHQGAVENMLNVAYDVDADVVDGDLLVFGDGVHDTVRRTTHGPKDAEGFWGFAHGKIIKSELFSQICFPRGYWFEDTLIKLAVLPMSNKFYGIPEIVYEYRQHQCSITANSRGNYKSIDSFYVTRRLLKDAKVLNIGISSEKFIDVLINRQIRINVKRISTIPSRKVQYAHFMLTKKMIEDIYSDLTIADLKAKKMLEDFLQLSFRDFTLNYV